MTYLIALQKKTLKQRYKSWIRRAKAPPITDSAHFSSYDKQMITNIKIYNRRIIMRKNIIAIALLSALCFTSCGKAGSSADKSSTAASVTTIVTAEDTTGTTQSETEATTKDTAKATDYSPADLVGEWTENDSFRNILTVNADGTFSLKYEGGGTRFGTVKVDSEEHPDGSFTYWYSFYDSENKLWTGFVCPEKPFNEIYSEDEGGMKFVRNDSGKPLAPTVPEAKDLRDALAFADRLMCGSGIETDINTEYKADDGTVYHKSVDNIYNTTTAVRNHLYRYMTEQFISSQYNYILGSESPKCIDVNGELYIEYRPIGGRYSFADEDPVIVESANGYSINIKNNSYGAEETVVLDVVKDNGSWKINGVRNQGGISMLDYITINEHSSIRIDEGKIIYCDPYNIKDAANDADIILLTHDHYDHYSPEDIRKVMKSDTVVVCPTSVTVPQRYGLTMKQVSTDDKFEVLGVSFETVPAYNIEKPYHPQSNGWVGYIIDSPEHGRIYIAGDTDITPENKQIKCDIALIPAGGTYTTDAEQAAKLANIIRPKYAIPIHYGTVAGSPADGERFRKAVDSSIEVVIKL
jgi:L-ascorbate metabolism protein UlaG (beta-lactamase superfamily)